MAVLKSVLCYGDSNTWGYDPASGSRFGYELRWPGVLRRTLGPEYLIIEEGLSGRTTVWDDPIEGYKNGKEYLIPCLGTHKPLDLVLIMLGTNDLKMRFSVPAGDIAAGAGVLVEIVQKSDAGPEERAPQVLLMAPPPVATLGDNAATFAGAESKSREFSQEFRRVAVELGCPLLDTGEVIVSSDLDGIHFEVEEHQKLGLAAAERVRAMLE